MSKYSLFDVYSAGEFTEAQVKLEKPRHDIVIFKAIRLQDIYQGGLSMSAAQPTADIRYWELITWGSDFLKDWPDAAAGQFYRLTHVPGDGFETFFAVHTSEVLTRFDTQAITIPQKKPDPIDLLPVGPERLKALGLM